MATAQQISLEKAIDCVEGLSPKEKTAIKQWMKETKSIDVLVTGKTGAGKSSLLNYLLGKTVFEVGGKKGAPCTSKVTYIESEKNGIKIRAWDSPGLQDGTGDAKYLKDLQDKCSRVDLMLYCISMEETRSDLHEHCSAIHKINALFGKQCWKNTVFVLTFANVMVFTLEAQIVSNDKIVTELQKRIDEWQVVLMETLTDLKVDKAVVKNVQVVPAGHVQDPNLPGYNHWISFVWSKCLLAMKKSAQAAFIQMETNGPSGGFIEEGEAIGIAKVSVDERKIVFTRGVKIAVGVVAGGIVTGGFAIGATVGATIGALAIGIPSFGVAAGAGLGIGAVVGGAVGGGVAAGVGALITLYRKRLLERKD